MLQRPNILWICLEDVSPWFGCYGHTMAETPFMDSLAAQGALFERCYATCPVCSPSRSANITGRWPSRLGHQHHRSSRTAYDYAPLPKGIATLPERLQKAGYLTFNFGKDDYNFAYDRDLLYSGAYSSHFHWKESTQKPDWAAIARMQPFFGQIQLTGGKRAGEAAIQPLCPDLYEVPLPGYYPDETVFREPISRHYGCIRYLDTEVRDIFRQLEKNGLRESTFVFLFADHGWDGLRDKQFCYEGGTHVPLIVVGPQGSGFETATRRSDLVSALDIPATTIALAGIDDGMVCDGIDLRNSASHRNHVVSQRDRCDYTLDCIRSVVSDRFRYIRNFCPDRPWLQPQYRSEYPEFKRWLELADQTSEDLPNLRFARDARPIEELFDLHNDPDQLQNLATDPAYALELERHQEWLTQWRLETGDPGPVFPEEQLLAVLLRWGSPACDHPAYDPVSHKYSDLMHRYPSVYSR